MKRTTMELGHAPGDSRRRDLITCRFADRWFRTRGRYAFLTRFRSRTNLRYRSKKVQRASQRPQGWDGLQADTQMGALISERLASLTSLIDDAVGAAGIRIGGHRVRNNSVAI